VNIQNNPTKIQNIPTKQNMHCDVAMLDTSAPQFLSCLTKEGAAPRPAFALEKGPAGWQRIEAMVDSGAVDSVAPAGLIGSYPLLEGSAARAGVRYLAADGGTLPNLGEQRVHVRTKEGHECGLTFQVADVQKPLIAVAQLTRAGNEVTMGDAGGKVTHRRTGRTIEFHKRNGVYMLDLWVKPGPEGATHEVAAVVVPPAGRGFPRPGVKA